MPRMSPSAPDQSRDGSTPLGAVSFVPQRAPFGARSGGPESEVDAFDFGAQGGRDKVKQHKCLEVLDLGDVTLVEPLTLNLLVQVIQGNAFPRLQSIMFR
ncbi:hypothetical protein M427DRAFT_233693 [Gonapodya prolifera JEL478]|uniref:Uncharacterized protein n=1 Tax=Gonapodya prolifera (strain JEL478) TaxID=1344416 RepID=A0A138ZY43_GONPJ|nr:hypothetical protein M427DRAFT_233693 [Gonapodya prolifera JEL478]|eukprot:KXS09381.1 hypothetical protein M427DRAFT_233693 [Gonapodya prolifera JEL478]